MANERVCGMKRDKVTVFWCVPMLLSLTSSIVNCIHSVLKVSSDGVRSLVFARCLVDQNDEWLESRETVDYVVRKVLAQMMCCVEVLYSFVDRDLLNEEKYSTLLDSQFPL